MVAIVGRPNVGKSSLFNRIMGRRQAIVSEIAGTTRDRLVAEADWEDHRFILVDTGGLEPNPEGQIREKVQEQADMAMGDADIIVFVADVDEGVTPIDHLLADRLRRTDKPVVLAVNKVDNDTRELAGSEFYQLGIADPIFISAYHNFGIHDLMEEVVSHFPSAPQGPVASLIRSDGPSLSHPSQIKLSIVGRTNVGKSLLVNTILGQDRSIVSEVAGTTRDAIDTFFTYEGNDMALIDTAGIRRPGKVQRGIEQYSVIRAVTAVNRSDIALLVTDASELAAAQDSHIAGLAWELCRGLIVVVNKWDLDPDGSRRAMERAANRVRQRFHFMTYVPIFFTSALHRRGITELMRGVVRLSQERLRRVPQRELQYALASALADHMPATVKGSRGRRVRFNRVEQVGVNPPTFQFIVDNPNLVHFSYQRFLENRLRSKFGFDHTHLKLVFTSK
ncbi:MAG: ribosome biogenesis GTPase Der [SAR202 cluster bacterium Io17-Chloro-G2]|nr:MAG: ribosome biogenesis GTPase Der [SAR202 cluster bacterium Io17-Chloro-G2]